MRYIKFLILIMFALMLCSCTNPQVGPGEVGYVTSQPLFIGEKGKFLDIIIGPGSYGLGWCNRIKQDTHYMPWTIKEQFTPPTKKDAQDTRILSVDQINMEVNISIVLEFRHAPSGSYYNKDKFKSNMKMYFENYRDAWGNRYREPFRARSRSLLAKESYSSAKKERETLSDFLKVWLSNKLKGTPFAVVDVKISNINMPKRLMEEQEIKKAVQIAEERQALEEKLQLSKSKVMKQEALNLSRALSINPKYLQWKELEVKQKYAEGFHTLITGEEAKSISKAIFVPYGTPIAAQ